MSSPKPINEKNIPQTLSDTDKLILQTVRTTPDKQLRVSEAAGVPWSSAKNSIDKLAGKSKGEKEPPNPRLITISEKKEVQINHDFALLCGVSVGKKTTVLTVLDFGFRVVTLDKLDIRSICSVDIWEKYGFRPAGADESEAIWSTKTPADTLLHITQMLTDLCAFALELNQKKPVLSIAFAFGDHVDRKQSMIVRSSLVKDFPMHNVGIYSLFTNAMIRRMRDAQINILFEQNAKAALVAERTVGCLQGDPPTDGILVYLGRGFGAAMHLNSRPYYGMHAGAGVRFGHRRVLYGEEAVRLGRCSCGAYGCLEAAVRSIFAPDLDFKNESGAKLAEWLDEEGHESQKQALAEYLSRAVLSACDLLDLDWIVFDGDAVPLFASIELCFQEKLIEQNFSSLRILSSELGASSAAIGAAICGYNDWLGERSE